MKILVTYASKHGSTGEIAEAITGELRKCGLDADTQEVDEVASIRGYDAVVLGSAIYAGNWLPEAKHFVEQHRTELGKRPVWLFSSGPLGMENMQPVVGPENVNTSIDDTPIRDHYIFFGKLDPNDLGFVERLMTMGVGAPYGDFRDWEEIRQWARSIAGELQQDAPSSVTMIES